MTNIYWPVYKNLESEIEKLMFSIHIDNKQLNVYSSKIADMILRAATEIESISKDLYQQNGGSETERKNIKYDSDAIKFLEQKWILSKKKVIISHHNYHGLNKELNPFEKNEKRTDDIDDIQNSVGPRTFGWNNSYQNLKHDRSQSLEFGSIRYLFNIMATLFILNIYYKDERFELEKNQKTIPSNMESSIFNIKIHQYSGYDGNHKYMKKEDFIECVYITKQTVESEEIWINAIQSMNSQNMEFFRKHPKFLQAVKEDSKLLENYKGKNLMWDILGKDEYIRMISTSQHPLNEASKKTKNEAILNKNQID